MSNPAFFLGSDPDMFHVKSLIPDPQLYLESLARGEDLDLLCRIRHPYKDRIRMIMSHVTSLIPDPHNCAWKA